MKPKTLVLPPKSRLDEVCSPQCRELLNTHFDPVWNESGRDYSVEELANMIPAAEVILTSWGSPPISEATLRSATKLRMIGHAAGTVKYHVPQSVFSRGLRLFSAAPRIALSVGEYCLSVLMTALRNIPAFDQGIRQGNWKNAPKGRELAGQTIGIVSASSTARAFIQLLEPFHVNVVVYDPYLSDEAAARLGMRKGTLEEVMSSPVISVHAPKLPATYKMLNKDLLDLIPDNAIFINSSRADVLDEEALIGHLKSGRFTAVLDVFTMEPLPLDNSFANLSNVILTPHIAGASVQGHLALMQEVVQDMLRCMRQEKTFYEVTEHMWATMA